MERALISRRRTPIELLGGAGRYAVAAYRGQRDVYRYARIIERNLYRPADELSAEQDRKIEAIVNYAYHNSRFYRRRFDAVGFKPGDVKNKKNLAMLPEVSKLELSTNIEDILCMPKEQLGMSSTGGTTGVGLNFYRDQHCLSFRRGIDLATTRYYGWRDGQWQGWLWGAARDVLEPKTLKARMLVHFAERVFYFDALKLDLESYRRFVKLMKKYHPTYMSAYPSLAYDLALRIEAGEIEPFRVPMVNFTAEPVYDFQREKLLATYAEEVYERYGSRESGMAALECPARKGMHYFTESVCFEAVSRGPEVPGKSLVVTDLVNYGMPIIRYQMGDFGEIDDTPCSCGRSTPRITGIQGRELDLIWCPDGHGVAGVMFAFLVARLEIRAALQLVQEKLDRIVIRVEAPPGTWSSQLAKLVEIYRREIHCEVNYEIQYVDKIERAPSGKYRYVISKVARPVSERKV